MNVISPPLTAAATAEHLCFFPDSFPEKNPEKKKMIQSRFAQNNKDKFLFSFNKSYTGEEGDSRFVSSQFQRQTWISKSWNLSSNPPILAPDFFLSKSSHTFLFAVPHHKYRLEKEKKIVPYTHTAISHIHTLSALRNIISDSKKHDFESAMLRRYGS